MARGVAAEEGSNLVAIAADGHQAPAAAMRAGIIVEEEAAGRVSAAANGRARAFDEEFGSGAGEGGEEPVQAAFAGNELERPGTIARDELVVTFGDAEDFVDGFGPGSREGFAVDKGSEDGAERFAEAKDAQENSIDGVRFRGNKRPETGRAMLGDQVCVEKKRDEFVPGEVMRGGGKVSKIECETASDQVGS